MGANSAAGSPGGGGTKAQAIRYSTKNEFSSAVKKIAEASPTLRLVKGIAEGFKTARTNSQLMGTSDYQGGSKSKVLTPMGNDRGDGASNVGAATSSGQIVQPPQVAFAPTTAEVSQSAATDVAEDDILLRKKRTKAVGRSVNILTASKGDTSSLTLGKPSLLGRA